MARRCAIIRRLGLEWLRDNLHTMLWTNFPISELILLTHRSLDEFFTQMLGFFLPYFTTLYRAVY